MRGSRKCMHVTGFQIFPALSPSSLSFCITRTNDLQKQNRNPQPTSISCCQHQQAVELAVPFSPPRKQLLTIIMTLIHVFFIASFFVVIGSHHQPVVAAARLPAGSTGPGDGSHDIRDDSHNRIPPNTDLCAAYRDYDQLRLLQGMGKLPATRPRLKRIFWVHVPKSGTSFAGGVTVVGNRGGRKCMVCIGASV